MFKSLKFHSQITKIAEIFHKSSPLNQTAEKTINLLTKNSLVIRHCHFQPVAVHEKNFSQQKRRKSKKFESQKLNSSSLGKIKVSLPKFLMAMK